MSYHEGSNWQAKKEDEGKPLYDNKKSNQSNTPLTEEQEFISFMEHYIYGSAWTREDKDDTTKKIWAYFSKYFPSSPVLSVPEPFLKYIQDAWDKIRINGEPIKFPVYGGSAFVVFEVKGNKRVYKLNLSLYNSEVTLDEFAAPSSPLSDEATINELRDDIEELRYGANSATINTVLEKFDNLIAALTAHPPVNNAWISVEDRLPEKGDALHIYSPTMLCAIATIGRIWTAYFNFESKQWIDQTTDKQINVTHWMPQPPPPVNKND